LKKGELTMPDQKQNEPEQITRYPDLVDERKKDREGEDCNGQFFFSYPLPSAPTGMGYDMVYFTDGKVHGSPAVVCYDGLEEEWEQGKFIKILKPPFSER
jgi:hypothetical protein